jgi:hypothetical protein
MSILRADCGRGAISKLSGYLSHGTFLFHS